MTSDGEKVRGTVQHARAGEALRTNENRMRRQKEAFQAAIDGAPLEDSLGILAHLITEETAGEARTAFYIADPDVTCLHPIRGAGDMPESYMKQVEGFVIGKDSLACGLATATERPVLSRDVFEEPLWEPWVHLAGEYDFRACWSFPIETRDGKPIGTFAQYFSAAREATPHDLALAHMRVAHQSLELYAALRESAPARAAERLNLARQTTMVALDQTRALSAELKRLQDEELKGGLEAAFWALLETVVPEEIRWDVSFSGAESAIPKPVETQVYLAMREAIRNAVRHSGCSHIRVRLAVGDGEVLGLVEDDGKGFEPEPFERPRRRGGWV